MNIDILLEMLNKFKGCCVENKLNPLVKYKKKQQKGCFGGAGRVGQKLSKWIMRRNMRQNLFWGEIKRFRKGRKVK